MSSPAPYPFDRDSIPPSNGLFVDMQTRPMRVKVLYTFDNDNKTNCLARFPEVFNIPTIPIDDTTQIGVIELRQCIRAIVAASPELVARLGQGDFTIYAYDYSEYDSPQVGQGMLSSILAAASPTPTAPAHQSKTMITGRVCKNIMALYTKNVTETLEVKLRLVPVPKPVQHDYLKSMEMHRSMNSGMSGGFDPNAWSDSYSTNQGFETPLDPNSMMSFPGSDAGQLQPTTLPNQQRQRHMSNASMQGRPLSRSQSMRGVVGGSRPSSRASVRSNRHGVGREEAFGGVHEDQAQDDGPAKKRAKITQTQWRGKTAFGAGDDSLRVAASTAASIRIHKPVPTRPGLMGSNSLEPPPRAPTPVPRRDLSGARPQPASFMRRESTLYNAQTPYSPFDQPSCAPSDAVMSSPEDMQMDENGNATPIDFPSSPPAMPAPSSPGLPPLPRPIDSGYLSGGFLECMQDDEDRPIDEEDLRMAQQYKQRPPPIKSEISFIEQTPGPPELLPTRMIHSQSHRGPSEMSHQKAQNSTSLHRRSSLALPPRPSSAQPASHNSASGQHQKPSSDSEDQQNDQISKPAIGRELSGSSMRSNAASPVPSDFTALSKLPRSGSGAKRKKVIQDKLMQSVAAGGLPMYCCNCGAIETPTWRSLHTKTIHGSPEGIDTSEKEGETMGIEVLEKDDESDTVTKYRLIKSMRKSRDKVEMQGYETVSVCNPCGLWFNKFKYMRPADKWNKNPKRRKSTKKDNLQSDMAEPMSDYPTDMPSGLWTDVMQPEDDVDENLALPTAPPEERVRPALRPRANSMQVQSRHNDDQWTETQLDAALQRAIQSSPARLFGTQESPIELEDDLTPKPTRRLLFPTPRKSGEAKSLDDSALKPTKQSQTSLCDGTADMNHDPFQIYLATAGSSDKENLPPLHLDQADDDDFSHLFEGSPSALLASIFKTPSKFSSANKTPPSKSIPNFDALLATPTPSRRTLSGGGGTRTVSGNRIVSNGSLTRTPNRTNIDAFLPTFSSSEKDKFFPTTPSRNVGLNFTSPGRSSITATMEAMTPFTRHLTQILSEGDGMNMNMNLNMNMNVFSSPGRPFDFSDLGMGMFGTPGRNQMGIEGLGFEVFDGQEGGAVVGEAEVGEGRS